MLGARSLSEPDQRLHRPAALAQVLARFDEQTVKRNATGHVAKEEPRRKDEQQQSDDGDKQTLPRCGNCQQPVELFTFFFCIGNRIVK